MHRPTLALLLACASMGCGPTDNGPDEAMPTARSIDLSGTGDARGPMPDQVEWQVSDSAPGVLAFSTGDTIRLQARDVRLITRLTAPSGKPWFVFSGIEDRAPGEQRSLFVLSPGDSLGRGIQHPWHMPGRLIDSVSAAPYYEASVFAGEVLRDTIGVVWYDRSLMPDGQWRLNTTLLQLGSAEPDTVILFGQGRKSATIDMAVKGKCLALVPLDQRTASP